MDLPSSLSRNISPPRRAKRRKTSAALSSLPRAEPGYDVGIDPTLAAVEAGRAKIEDHLTYFKHRLAEASRTTPLDVPRLSIHDFASLYRSNSHQHGHHFVVHQHNHPRAGVHYDLRLQFSATSSVSWALPKGLPGNPNSRQLGRMAIETRVHNLWNNLVESASMKTGSLLIWDTGTYTVLPRKKNHKDPPSQQTTDDDSELENVDLGTTRDAKYENKKLIEAFKSRHIRLRLHGTRLPKDYTITLRLPSNNAISVKPAARRRKSKPAARSRQPSYTSDSDTAPPTPRFSRRVSKATSTDKDDVQTQDDNDLDTDSSEDTHTRVHNAYPGATNSINSIHQRRWFVLLDRPNSGFELLGGGKWTRRVLSGGELGGFDAFVVRGREWEKSVVTGRLAREIERDGGCEGFIGRGGWVGIEE